ncbi:hypothetical protein VNO77_04089 [Canavalia gladiata]|uniref:Uncharacterized protein n=1 Tax=Canavalia gladiata TaxID=3824 RepID=A0AAN9MWL1_CANGL
MLTPSLNALDSSIIINDPQVTGLDLLKSQLQGYEGGPQNASPTPCNSLLIHFPKTQCGREDDLEPEICGIPSFLSQDPFPGILSLEIRSTSFFRIPGLQ